MGGGGGGGGGGRLICMRNVAEADANQPARFELRRPRPEVEAIEAANVILSIEYRQQ